MERDAKAVGVLLRPEGEPLAGARLRVVAADPAGRIRVQDLSAGTVSSPPISNISIIMDIFERGSPDTMMTVFESIISLQERFLTPRVRDG